MNEETENIRETAIASLRNDPGLHQLVPYLVAFIAEKVSVSLNDRFSVFERRVTDDE
jgi:transcription initiation factor TFIID subunit 6